MRVNQEFFTKMKTKWFQYVTVLIYLRIRLSHTLDQKHWGTPEVELQHDPFYYRTHLSPYIESTEYQIPGLHLTPDYREVEAPFYAHQYQFYKEENRPYRMSPHYVQASRWGQYTSKENPDLMGCYCTTVYKRLTPLAGCAVLTTRHLLTTATSTQLVLEDHPRNLSVTNILGAWYDHNGNVWNSSMYMTPARIHYHPLYLRKENTNISHPITGYFDLALWAATYPFYGNFISWSKTCLCNRGSSHAWSYAPSTPHGELLIIVGFQYIMAWKKVPMPWYKYAVRTRDTVNPCPKTEWGWYHCVPADWATFGIEPGAALHRTFQGTSWRFDGLIALNQFSMRLRSGALIHYFHPLDTHAVLDFLYLGYNGRLKYDYLDPNFIDTQWGSPVAIKPISWDYTWGVEQWYNHVPFNY